MKYSIAIFLSFLVFPQKIDSFYLVQRVVSLRDHTTFIRPLDGNILCRKSHIECRYIIKPGIDRKDERVVNPFKERISLPIKIVILLRFDTNLYQEEQPWEQD